MGRRQKRTREESPSTIWSNVSSAAPDTASSSGSSAQLGDLATFGCDDDGCTIDKLGLLEDPSSELTSVEPDVVRRFIARPSAFPYNLCEVTASGGIRNISIARGDLLEAMRMRPRDLRAVAVQPLPGADVGPVLACRRDKLLLGFGEIRAVVDPSRALLFGAQTRGRTRFLRVLENQRRAIPESGFMMAFTESALLALSRQLSSRLVSVRRVVEPKLGAPPVLREPDLEEVRQQRRALVRCASQASAVSAALLARLDGDEVAPLALASGVAADEWEAMLEVFLQAYTELSRECSSLLMDIEDFEGSASLALQARRLRVEQFELNLVIASVSVGASGLLPGTMGMNLLSGLEQSDRAFSLAVAATLTIAASLFVVLRWLAAQQGFFS